MEQRSPAGSTHPGHAHLRWGGQLPPFGLIERPAGGDEPGPLLPRSRRASGRLDPLAGGRLSSRSRPGPHYRPSAFRGQRGGQPFRLQPLRRTLPALMQPSPLLRPLCSQGRDPNRDRPEQFSGQALRRRPGLNRGDGHLFPENSKVSLIGGSHD